MRRPRGRLLCCAKQPGEPSDDAAALSGRDRRYALSDGASTSYAGRAWARLLSRRFVAAPVVDMAWLAAARREFVGTTQPEPADWLGDIAFRRGSHATLLGFTLEPGRVTGFAVGDTVLFVGAGETWRHHPPLAAEAFANDPVLLASHPATGALADTDEALRAHRFALPMEPAEGCNATLLAMTDALAAWTLGRDVPGRLARLAALADRAALRQLVRDETAAGRMRVDDVTLLVVEP